MERKDGSILLSPRLDEGQRQKIKCLKSKNNDSCCKEGVIVTTIEFDRLVFLYNVFSS